MQKTYHQHLIDKLLHPGMWPHFERPDFMNELDGIAEDAFFHRTMEGYLGALLIYSQLAEDMIRILLKNIEFLEQLRHFPKEIHFPEYERETFGQIIGILNKHPEFSKKDIFIIQCQELNKIRREIVHQLTKYSGTEIIVTKIELAQSFYETAYSLFSPALYYFQAAFRKYAEDSEWVAYAKEYISNHGDL